MTSAAPTPNDLPDGRRISPAMTFDWPYIMARADLACIRAAEEYERRINLAEEARGSDGERWAWQSVAVAREDLERAQHHAFRLRDVLGQGLT